MEKTGFKEIGDLLEALFEVAVALIEVGADGFQMTDLAELWNKLWGDEEVRKKLQDAYDGVGDIKDEIEDLSLNESMSLAMKLVPKILKLVTAIRGA